MYQITWKTRLAIVLSVVWLALAAIVSRSESDSIGVFFVLGVFPIAILWGFAWVWTDFRKARRPKSTPASSTVTLAAVDTPVPRATLFVWLGTILSTIAIGVFWYAISTTGTNALNKIAYSLGFYFWVPIVAYFVWKRSFQKKEGMGVFLFSVAFLAVAGYESYSMLRDWSDAKRFLGETQAMMLKLLSGEQIDRLQISGFGEYTPALLVTHDFFSLVQKDLESLTRAIEASELEQLLTPKTLRSQSAIAHAQERLLTLQKRVDEIENRVLAAYNDFPKMVDATSLRSYFKSEFKSGAEKGIMKGKISMSEFFRIQRMFIDEALSLLRFLQKNHSSYGFRGDQILFVSQSDLERYNRHIQNIQQLALQEAEWRNTQFATSAKQLRRLEDLRK